jgi:glycosyltransferase involved in cell wall biosynthesis
VNIMPMKIIVIMLGKTLGGIEQVALDYCIALKHAGCDVLFVTSTDAAIIAKASAEHIPMRHIRNLGAWDRLAAWRLKRICSVYGADAIITHGNRALNLVAMMQHHAAHITVAHNYLNKHFHKTDGVFCITRALQQHVQTQHPSLQGRCIVMPNMIRSLPPSPRTAFHTPVRIAALGRMVAKKGFDVWLQALATLKARHIPFEAWLGGDGEERSALEQLCSNLGLSEQVHFKGWVSNTQPFLSECDIFCLPSHHEPFGVVLLEAMNAALPIISTASEGPSEIITAFDIGVLTPIGDAHAMADALEYYITNPNHAIAQGNRAHQHVTTHYDLLKQADILRDAITKICTLKP